MLPLTEKAVPVLQFEVRVRVFRALPVCVLSNLRCPDGFGLLTGIKELYLERQNKPCDSWTIYQ